TFDGATPLVLCSTLETCTQKLRSTPMQYAVSFPFPIIDSVTGTPKGPLTCPLGAAGMGLDLPRHQSEPGFRTTTFPSSPSSGCEPDGPSTLPGHISKLTLNENSGSPLAPPTKRHCRSLSEPGGLSRCRSPWKPGSGSKIWTPISKQRCSSGGPASPSCGRGHLLATGRGTPGVAMSPVPRPASASSGFVGSGGQSSGPSSPSSSCCSSLAVPRRLSLSQEHIPDSASSTPLSTPELGRRLGLPRCRSQPCVLQDRKGGLKRRREDEVRWSRPSLDFLKMTQVSSVPKIEKKNQNPTYDFEHLSSPFLTLLQVKTVLLLLPM
uniref:Family with sequence similarity 53 member A n=1 Tax=Scleropages formosus TaxID=113540 RepID=A0A8C9VMH7_SCLFO